MNSQSISKTINMKYIILYSMTILYLVMALIAGCYEVIFQQWLFMIIALVVTHVFESNLACLFYIVQSLLIFMEGIITVLTRTQELIFVDAGKINH